MFSTSAITLSALSAMPFGSAVEPELNLRSAADCAGPSFPFAGISTSRPPTAEERDTGTAAAIPGARSASVTMQAAPVPATIADSSPGP